MAAWSLTLMLGFIVINSAQLYQRGLNLNRCGLHPLLQVNGGMEPDADVGPMITPEAKQRAEALIQAGIDQVRGALL
jgi:hypothetical protein